MTLIHTSFLPERITLDAIENVIKDLTAQNKQGNIECWRLFAKIYVNDFWESTEHESYIGYCAARWEHGKTHACNLVWAGIAIEFICDVDPAALRLPVLKNMKFATKLGKVPPLLREKIWNNYRTDRVPIPHYNTHLSMKKCKKLGEALDKLYRFYQPEEIFTEIIPSLRLKDAVMLIELLSSKIRSLQEQNDSSQLTG